MRKEESIKDNEIYNFKLKEFLEQTPELVARYLLILSRVNPIETKKKVFFLKLKNVEFIKKNLFSSNDSDLIKIVSKVQGIKKKEVYEIEIIKFFGIVNSIKEQIKEILKAEENSLTPANVNVKWEMVQGSARMAKFEIYNTLRALSPNDKLKYKKWMEVSYSEVFTILLQELTISELEQEMSEIKLKV